MIPHTMDINHKRRIKANTRYLIGQIRVSDIRDYLYEKGVLNEDDIEELDPSRQTNRNSVRMLIQILVRKGPKTYNFFCDALKEADYDHVVEKLNDTDLNAVEFESEDMLDSFVVEEVQIAEIQRTLWKTTEMLEQYKREVDAMKNQMQTKEERQARYRRLESEILDKGYTEEYVIECLKEYMQKSQGRDEVETLDVPPGKRLPSSPMMPGSASKNEIIRVAMELSEDVIAFMTTDNPKSVPMPNRYAKVMRTNVKRLTESQSNVFRSFIEKLSLSDANGFEMLQNIADEMFRVGQNNWGRIVALYAFGGFVARHACENKMDSISKYIGDYLGKYVAKNLSIWIEEKGGWDDFEKFFTEQESAGLGWTGLFLTAIGLGALVSLASVRGSM